MRTRGFRVGIFDQIVSGGGGRIFTLKLLEEFSRIAGGRWHFHLMWPLFDSSNNFLAPPDLPNVRFERICVDAASARWNKTLSLIHRYAASRRWPERWRRWASLRAAHYRQKICVAEQRKLRLGDGRGLRWLGRRSSEFDLLYVPYPYLTLPGDGEWRPRLPLVVTLHDLAHEQTDAWGEVTGVLRREVRRWTELASLVIFSSDYVKREAQRLYGLPSERARRIYLVPPAATDGAQPASDVHDRYGLDGEYVLTLGWAAKHKKVETILEGFALFKKKSHSRIRLVLAGPETQSFLGKNTYGLTVGEDVIALGYVPDADVAALYRRAALVVTASISEAGFNAMLFDAMYYRKPVVCSNIPQFVERLGTDDALALTFDPHSPASLAAALAQHFDDPEEAERRVDNAKRFIDSRTLRNVAEEYLAAFESVLERQ